MEEEKIQRLHDTLSKLRRSEGLGMATHFNFNSSTTDKKRTDGLPTNALYSNFLKEGSYDPNTSSALKYGDGRAIKRNFDDCGKVSSSDDESSTNSEERKRRKKLEKKEKKKAAKLEAKRQAKLEEKRRLKLQEKKLKAKKTSTKTQKSSNDTPTSVIMEEDTTIKPNKEVKTSKKVKKASKDKKKTRNE